jgi:hypothetical protein
MMGLLEKEASKLGLIFSKVSRHKRIEHFLDLDENDTHYCFTISFGEQHLSDGDSNNDTECIFYMKTGQNNNNQWFIYDRHSKIVIPFDAGEETTKKEMPLFFDEDNDTKVIFYDCQGAIFFVNKSPYTLDVGRMSHLLMDDSLEMNIGMCPIGTRSDLPSKVNLTLDKILTHHRLTGKNRLLHTLLIGKISNEQKDERAISKVKSLPEWNEILKAYLSEKLPTYMIPSHFMAVSTFPLSSNGKIDRNSLPQISMSVLEKEKTHIAPSTELEKTIANIWQQLISANLAALYYTNSKSKQVPSITNGTILSTDGTASSILYQDSKTSSHISTTTSFFDFGGDSLVLIQIYRYYHSLFHFDTELLTIRPFFIQNTLAEHAKLLEPFVINKIKSKQWHTLHIEEGKKFFYYYFNIYYNS